MAYNPRSNVSTFNNLVMVQAPGRPFLGPSSIGGLTSGTPGQVVGLGWPMGGMYDSPPGKGVGGNDPSGEMVRTETDKEVDVTCHYAVQPTADGTHMKTLYKNIPCFLYKGVPKTKKEAHIIIAIHGLNTFLTTRYGRGLDNWYTFVDRFMRRHLSWFPDLGAIVRPDVLRLGGGGSQMGASRTFFSAGSGRRTRLGNVGGGDDSDEDYDYDDDTDDNNNNNNNGNTSDSEETNVNAIRTKRKGGDDFTLIMNAFCKFARDVLPEYRQLGSKEGKLGWLSQEFTPTPRNRGEEYTAIVKRATEEEQSSAGISAANLRHGLGLGGGGGAAGGGGVFMEGLKDGILKISSLSAVEVLPKGASASGGSSSNNNGIITPDILNQLTNKKLAAFQRERHEKEMKMIGEIMAFFRGAVEEAPTKQWEPKYSGIPYLLKGPVMQNWGWIGPVNTNNEDNRDVYAYGKVLTSHCVVKMSVGMEAEMFNLWGPGLKQDTVLYWRIGRRYLNGQKKVRAAIFSNPNIKPVGMKDLREEACWKDYGAYEAVPYTNGVLPPDRHAYYLDIFGRRETYTYVEVGRTKYDVPLTNHYNFVIRNEAVGLPSAISGLLPTMEQARASAISMPFMTVVLRQ